MSKRKYMFFGGFLNVQESWLNQMALKGYRLSSVKRMLYVFEECKPGEVEYRIDFVAPKSIDKIQEYKAFFEEMGYKVFYKNINLNYSLGKIRLRPWATEGGYIATKSTTYNKELLIVEKFNDGKDFELHTSYEDQINYYKSIRNPWLTVCLLWVLLTIFQWSLLYIILKVVVLIPVLLYEIQIQKLKREARIRE